MSPRGSGCLPTMVQSHILTISKYVQPLKMGNDLDSCPTRTPSEATSESYGYTIRAMKLSSFLEFGFVIYRCTYSGDVAWTQLLSLIKRESQENIKQLGPRRAS